MPKSVIGAIANRLSSSIWPEPDAVRYFVRVSVWGRWGIWLIALFTLAYRPADWYPADIEFVLVHVLMAACNGLVHYRLLTNRPVTWRWMLFLSAADITLATGSIVIGGGFQSFVFLGYYAALAIFGAVFTSLWIGLAGTTVTAVFVVLADGCKLANAQLQTGTCYDPDTDKCPLAWMWMLRSSLSRDSKFADWTPTLPCGESSYRYYRYYHKGICLLRAYGTGCSN